MSDIRLIMVGSVVVFAGFYVMGLAGSEYTQISMQSAQFGECYDYSAGSQIHVSCDQQILDSFLLLAAALGIIGGGGFVIYKGIKGKWDQNVKPDEMLGPKGNSP